MTGKRLGELKVEHLALSLERAKLILAESIPLSSLSGIYGHAFTDAERNEIERAHGADGSI